VRKDDARAVLLQADSADEPGPDTLPPPLPRIMLLVDIEGGQSLPEQNARLFPIVKIPSGPQIPVLRCIVACPILPENETDDVVRVATMEFTSEFVGDHIVGWRDDCPKVSDLLHSVAIPPKRTETGHASLHDTSDWWVVVGDW
jgi:hypothetical protein